MPGSSLCSDPIDMAGYRTLRVEAHLSGGREAGPGHVSLRILGTHDGKTDRKSWVVKGEVVGLQAGASVATTFEDLGRFARVEAEALPGVGEAGLEVRIFREE